jgi:hypothetical protein
MKNDSADVWLLTTSKQELYVLKVVSDEDLFKTETSALQILQGKEHVINILFSTYLEDKRFGMILLPYYYFMIVQVVKNEQMLRSVMQQILMVRAQKHHRTLELVLSQSISSAQYNLIPHYSVHLMA